MSRLVLVLIAALGTASACAAETRGPIPEAVQGCWHMEEGPEFQSGPEEIRITDRTITRQGRVAGVELINTSGPTFIEGRFTAYENGKPVTVATELRLGDGEQAAPGQLLLREGDAGSYVYDRCKAG